MFRMCTIGYKLLRTAHEQHVVKDSVYYIAQLSHTLAMALIALTF